MPRAASILIAVSRRWRSGAGQAELVVDAEHAHART
jgi:hypothetical protein